MKSSLTSKTFASTNASGHHHATSGPLSAKFKPIQRKRLSNPLKDLNLSRSSSISTLASPGLTALRSRNHLRVASPDPQLASQVVTNYLLPMFEAETQLRGDVSRSAVFGTFKSPKSILDPVPGTVYGELKLSDQLNKELARLKQELKETTNRLREAEQSKASAESDLLHFKDMNLAYESSMRALQLHTSQDLRKLQQTDLTEGQLRQELKTLQESYAALEESNKACNVLLQDQYAVIDKLRNKATQQEHINSLLTMENDIIGERLKGLYFAIQKVADTHHLEELLKSEVSLMGNSIRILVDFTEEIKTKLRTCTYEKDAMRTDNVEMVALRVEMKAERDKIAKVTKDKITDLLGSLQRTEEERDKLQSKFEEMEKSFKDLTDEYEKMRQKAKQYRMRRKQYGEEEEKSCRKFGHVALSCPRDPNLRSTYDVKEEIHRIQDINAVKRKADEQMETGLAMEILLEKTGNLMFNHDYSPNSSSSSDQSGSNDLDEDDEVLDDFREIQKIKDKLEFNPSAVRSMQNLLQVEQEVSKERDMKSKPVSKPKSKENTLATREKSTAPVGLTQEAMMYLTAKAQDLEASPQGSDLPTPRKIPE